MMTMTMTGCHVTSDDNDDYNNEFFFKGACFIYIHINFTNTLLPSPLDSHHHPTMHILMMTMTMMMTMTGCHITSDDNDDYNNKFFKGACFIYIHINFTNILLPSPLDSHH